LVSRSKSAVSEKYHLAHFDGFINEFVSSLRHTLQPRVDKDLADLTDPSDASKALALLEANISKVTYFLTSCLNNHDRIPREIYYAQDWFMRHCPQGAEDIRYICTLDSKLAMVEFAEIMMSFNYPQIYPELITSLQKFRFYFILVPPEF